MCTRALTGGGGKKHFACFACRKCFKQPGSAEWQTAEAARPFPCPECGRPMADMGSDFKAPRQRDWRQWLKVEVLHSFGITFRPGCCEGPGKRPAEFRDLEVFLVSRRRPVNVVRARIAEIRASRCER